jgi:hypothetical protein
MIRLASAEFPLVQTKIVDFFKIQRNPLVAAASSETKKRKRRPVVVTKKKRKLLPFNPCEDPAQRLRQMASLATALTATGAAFSNHLTYQPGMAPRAANRAALEAGGMQVTEFLSFPPFYCHQPNRHCRRNLNLDLAAACRCCRRRTWRR